MGRRGRRPFAAIGERRAGSGPFDRDCERRALSAPRRRKPGSLRGVSVHYWASPLEAKLCAGHEVALVGAGNSAGQAAVYLASKVSKVWLLARGGDIAASMSRYLVDRIAGLPNVEVLMRTEVTELEGSEGRLTAISWRCRKSGAIVSRPIRHLFLFIGAEPNTDWLAGSGVGPGPRGVRA